MGSQIAGRPLVIPTATGNVTATPTAEGKVNLEQNGKNQTIEMKEFEQFLIANAPKIQQGDTTSFSGEKNVAPDPSEKKSGTNMLKLLGLAVITGIGIWQRKNIMEFGKGLIQKMKKIFLSPETATKKGIRTNKADTIYAKTKAALSKKPEFSPEALDTRLGVGKPITAEQQAKKLADLEEAFSKMA